VALHFLKVASEPLEEEVIPMVSEVCVGLHYSVEKETATYLRETGKHYYVTPPSYL
jgi:dynein heavy chain